MPDPSAPQEQQLKALLELYKAGKLDPVAYHKERMRILDKPAEFYVIQPVDPVPVIPSYTVVPQVGTSAGGAGASQKSPAAQSPTDGGDAEVVLDAAVIPGADLVLHLNLQSIRQSPIYKTLDALSAASATGAPSPLNMGDAGQQLEKILGIKEADVIAIVLSADLDGIAMSPMGPDPSALKSLNAVMGVVVAKDISTAQLKEAILAMAASQDPPEAVELAEDKIGDTDILALVPTGEDDLPMHLAVRDGRQVFLGLNYDSLKGALDRAEGAVPPLEPAMAGVMKSITADSQMKLGFVVPAALKAMIGGLSNPDAPGGDDAGTGDAGAGMGAMLAPLKEMRSLSFGLNLGEGLALTIAGDMGSGGAATGVGMLLGMLKPQFQAAVAEQIGRSPAEIPDNVFASSVRNGVVTLLITLGKDLITPLVAD
jgi:hypothetical protein